MKLDELKWKRIKDGNHILYLKPGMLLQFEDGEIILVGDVNSNYGECDCCCRGKYPSHYCDYFVKTIENIKKNNI